MNAAMPPLTDLGAWLQVAAMLIVLVLSVWTAGRRGLDAGAMYWAGVLGIAGALFGGRLVTMTISGAADVIEVFDLSGPRGVLGSMLGTLVFSATYLRARRCCVVEYADAAAPAVALGYVLARFGCLLAGDCYGLPTDLPWGLRFGPGSEVFGAHVASGWIEPGAATSLAVHPTQVYHAMVGAAGLAALLAIDPRRRGARLAAALVGYGVARFFLEFLRGDAVALAGAFDLEQLLCIALVGLGALVWVQRPLPDPAARRQGAAA